MFAPWRLWDCIWRGTLDGFLPCIWNPAWNLFVLLALILQQVSPFSWRERKKRSKLVVEKLHLRGWWGVCKLSTYKSDEVFQDEYTAFASILPTLLRDELALFISFTVWSWGSSGWSVLFLLALAQIFTEKKKCELDGYLSLGIMAHESSHSRLLFYFLRTTNLTLLSLVPFSLFSCLSLLPVQGTLCAPYLAACREELVDKKNKKEKKLNRRVHFYHYTPGSQYSIWFHQISFPVIL